MVTGLKSPPKPEQSCSRNLAYGTQSKHWSAGYLGVAFLLVGDLFALFDASALSYLCRFEWHFFMPPHPNPAPVVEYLKLWAVGIYLCLLLFHAYGFYQRDSRRAPLDVIAPLLKSGTWALALILAVSYFYRDATFSRIAALYNCGFAFCLLAAFRCSFAAYRKSLLEKGIGCKRVALVGSLKLPRKLAQRIQENLGYGYQLCAILDEIEIDSGYLPELEHGTLGDLDGFIERLGIEEVFVGHPNMAHHQLLELISICEARGVSIRMVPATHDLLIDRSDFTEVGGIPLLSINEQKRRSFYHFTKRVVDAVAAAILLVALSPVFLVIGWLIRRGSSGPVFFCQERVGKDGRYFMMIKFRTMVENAQQLLCELVDIDQLDEPVFKIVKDPRVTPVGRFLRRCSLDELPQLVNVLLGDMSIVGPRPEESQVVSNYDISQRRRLKLTPGITGLQQVHCRGTTSMKERVKWDILYLRQQSFVLDSWILYRTIGTVISGRGIL